MRTLAPLPPDPALFAPYGAFLRPAAQSGVRAHLGNWLTPAPAGFTIGLHLNHVAPATLPVELTEVEFHPHTAQIFLPFSVSRYLVTVMPATAAGAPDPAHAQAFLVPGDTGVVFRSGAWHAGMRVLDRPASFTVAMWRNPEGEDDVFAPIEPLQIALPGKAAK